MSRSSQNRYMIALDDIAQRIGCISLYRYRPINSNEIDALEKGYLWFHAADDFNDPFEGTIKLKEVEQDTTMEIALQISTRRNNEKPELTERVFEIPNLLAQSNDYYKRIFQSMLSHTKVCCFSKSKTNELMWAHYADKHKGMVLEYNISFDLKTFSFALPVIYHEKLPEINFMAQQDKSILSVLENKSERWSYEQEVRIINDNPRGTNNKIPIDPNALRSVIFGCKMSEEHKRKIKTALQKYPHIIFQHCRKSDNEYELIIESEVKR